MKTQFIFSVIVFSSLALFSSVNFAKSSEYSGNCQIYVSKDGTEGSYLPAGFVFVTAQLNGTTIPERGDLDLSVPNVIGTSHQRWNPNEVKNLMKTPGMTVGRALTQSQFKHQKVNCPDTKRSASIEFQVKVDSIASKKVKPGLWDLKKIEGADCDMNPKEFDEDPFNDRFMKRGCDLTVYKFVHGSVKRIENGKITKVDNSELEKINGYFPQVPDNNLHITHALIETDTPGKYVRCLITETLASSQDINCLDKVNQIKQLISTKKISSGYLILAEDPKKKGQPLTYKGNRSAYGVITKMIELKKEVIFEVELISVQQEFLAVKNRSPAFKN